MGHQKRIKPKRCQDYMPSDEISQSIIENLPDFRVKKESKSFPHSLSRDSGRFFNEKLAHNIEITNTCQGDCSSEKELKLSEVSIEESGTTLEDKSSTTIKVNEKYCSTSMDNKLYSNEENASPVFFNENIGELELPRSSSTVVF